MESPSGKRALKPRIRTPFSPKMTSSGSPAPSPSRRPNQANLVPTYSPQPRIFNSRKKMTAEIAALQERIAAVEKAKAILTQANTKLHLEFRTLTEELNEESSILLKRNEKLADKTKFYRVETARMKGEIAQLEVELDENAKSNLRRRYDMTSDD